MASSALPRPHLFGIRHHGPGCARSLLRALDALQPDCLLVEGPPEADALLAHLADEALVPPVALLSYLPDEPQFAVFHPFAEFSPEWQALRWAVRRGIAVRFIDLPLTHALALQRAEAQAAEAEAAAAAAAGATDAPEEAAQHAAPGAAPEVAGPDAADTAADTASDEEARDREPDETPPAAPRRDPLDWLAQAAGYGDGESWWNHMVEERGDGEELFAAIAEAMGALREQFPAPPGREAEREALREAHMRQCLREAQKAGHARIAVVCGAWHVPALAALPPAKADAALLKGLPKAKVQSTWVPWSHRHLTSASGYRAGIDAPGWYEHLWRHEAAAGTRAIGWLARVARLLRERDLDCSSAHLIEAARLADTLAALRERPAPGLAELNEATLGVICQGQEAPLRLIEDALIVGDRLGRVPPDVPTVPLQRDLEQAQKRLRLKPEALQRTLDLDLRNDTDLARSHLLHRLRLLGIEWGVPTRHSGGARGTFHEVWTLQWQPELALALVEASRWGQTVAQAATARVAELAASADLAGLAKLVDRVLLADLADAVPQVSRTLEARAALTGDTRQLLAALPPLAGVFRYGNVRRTDTALVAHVLDSLIARAAIGLPLAACALDEDAAQALRQELLAAHEAVTLREAPEQASAWQRALGLVAHSEAAQALLRGLACRLLLDAQALDLDEAARQLARQLSAGAPPAEAAAWLEGFLNRNAVVLLHQPAVWGLVDRWLAGLSEEHFVRIAPLVRRTFAEFSAPERRDLGERARRPAGPLPAGKAAPPAWDAARAALPLPLLRQILGLST